MKGSGLLTSLGLIIFYLVAKTEGELIQMAQELTSMLKSIGLSWKKSSLKVMSSTKEVADYFFLDGGDEYFLVNGVEYTTSLGVKIPADGCSEPAVIFRLGKGTAQFYGLKDALLTNTMALAKRFEMFYDHVIKCVLFGQVDGRGLMLCTSSWGRGRPHISGGYLV